MGNDSEQWKPVTKTSDQAAIHWTTAQLGCTHYSRSSHGGSYHHRAYMRCGVLIFHSPMHMTEVGVGRQVGAHRLSTNRP